MDCRLQLVAGPAKEPVTEEEAREQCRIRHSQSDSRLRRLIKSAREQAEGRTRRALIRQEWKQTQRTSSQRIRLVRWPVLAVLEVSVGGVPLDLAGLRIGLGDDGYVESDVSFGCPDVEVRYEAGYGSEPADVPESIRDWMLVQIADAYANPGSVVIGTINSKLDFIDGKLNQYIVPR